MLSNTSEESNNEYSFNLTSLVGGVSGSLSATLIGLALGGPIGTTIGAVSGSLVSFAVEALTRRRLRAEEVLVNAAKCSCRDLNGFIDDLLKSRELTDLALHVLNAAANSTFEAKLYALSVLLSRASNQPLQNLDQNFILVRIIDSLDPVHVAVLSTIESYNNQSSDAIGCTPETLIKIFPEYQHLLRSVVRTLELNGLIIDEARLKPIEDRSCVYWILSDFGKALLKIIETGQGILVGDEHP